MRNFEYEGPDISDDPHEGEVEPAQTPAPVEQEQSQSGDSRAF